MRYNISSAMALSIAAQAAIHQVSDEYRPWEWREEDRKRNVKITLAAIPAPRTTH